MVIFSVELIFKAVNNFLYWLELVELSSVATVSPLLPSCVDPLTYIVSVVEGMVVIADTRSSKNAEDFVGSFEIFDTTAFEKKSGSAGASVSLMESLGTSGSEREENIVDGDPPTVNGVLTLFTEPATVPVPVIFSSDKY